MSQQQASAGFSFHTTYSSQGCSGHRNQSLGERDLYFANLCKVKVTLASLVVSRPLASVSSAPLLRVPLFLLFHLTVFYPSLWIDTRTPVLSTGAPAPPLPPLAPPERSSNSMANRTHCPKPCMTALIGLLPGIRSTSVATLARRKAINTLSCRRSIAGKQSRLRASPMDRLV